MISEKLKTIVDEINPKGKMAFLESATEEQIAEFEKKHDCQLPKQYREWLQYSDGGELYLPAGVQFYGVAHKPLIDVTADDRPDDNYIVIGALATGDPILFEKGKECISIYNHEDGRIEEDETYEDYFAFLSDLDGILGIGG